MGIVQGWNPLDGLWDTVRENWYLGFTSFGGPPVHFKIYRNNFTNKVITQFHDKFVVKKEWIDEQVYQELFSVCQAFSGPGSTKMHYCINLIHSGFPSAVVGWLIWSLPGAFGMWALAVGVSNISTTLPTAVYALLSGLNAATVGIIALAAVQLAGKAITDKMTRMLVFLGAAAGMLYNALWYFPLLMVLAGCASVVYDKRWLHPAVGATARRLRKLDPRKRRKKGSDEPGAVEMGTTSTAAATGAAQEDREEPDGKNAAEPSAGAAGNERTQEATTDDYRHRHPGDEQPSTAESEPRVVPPERQLSFSWKFGLALILLFLLSFTAAMILRGVLPDPVPILYSLFANMYLAGTIIFGGGPVVIPLLREYVVAEGWVSPRDFLIGLALIQAFPGPNFNFAVYLGALTAMNFGHSSGSGALLGGIGMFLPGLWTVHGTMGVWGAIRGLRWVRSALRGVNAAAVGLIYTAVYRLWQIGYLHAGAEAGTSLANDPWWVVVTATSYVGGCWFGMSPPVAILLGGVMGLIRYGVDA
ncbi:hypothetical protein MKZ38_008220 [Zalerion maritima]|uniref:Chromate transporter n=1 Tax=Zalerion maritima TaxID=339359 RepID=A0AAD5RI70_9PEZI|nr:hypothetical protein MKZ38_008220 [Zalerion maritima]